MIVIEPHYLGSIEYFVLLKRNKKILLEINDSFKKQTYRSRTYLLTANKVQLLSIPVKHSNSIKTKEVKIDYNQRWVKDHWGAFYSGYGKAPFFEHFVGEIQSIWKKNYVFLLDLNISFFEWIIKILQLDIEVSLTKDYKKDYKKDYRNMITPKIKFYERNIYHSYTYSQLFQNTFVPNLSIIDLIMCEGPNAIQTLINSHQKTK